MSYTNPTVADFKAYFVRDFEYGTNPKTQILNVDVANAIVDSGNFINEDLFTSQSAYTTGFNLLAAHFLVMNIRAATQGLQGKFAGIESSKSVGSVSQSFAIPERFLENPEYSMLVQTYYGAKFLFMVLPQLNGQIFTVDGATQA